MKITRHIFSVIKALLLVTFITGLALIPATPVHAMTGAGTAINPYIIYDVTDLQNVSLDTTAYYELNNNIDASATITWNAGAGFAPLAFTGHFDGKGYTINDLYIYRPTTANAALFGNVGAGATITNTHLVNPAIFGMLWAAGFAIDIADATITYCSVTGGLIIAYDTGATGYAAGFVVQTRNATIISYCYTDTNVYAKTANSAAVNSAGFVGYVRQTTVISDCYALGTVQGAIQDLSWDTSEPVGTWPYGAGFVYRMADTSIVDNCYFAGFMDISDFFDNFGTRLAYSFCQLKQAGNSITNCFYDYEVGTATIDEGSATSKTTALMKTQSTFTDAGWDFTTPDWLIDSFNNGYPRLSAFALIGLVIRFDPIAIIVGDTLPDRSTQGNDGTFTWGTNPGGVSATLGSLISPSQPSLVTGERGTRDVLPDIATEDWFVEPDVTGSLTTNPFRPIITVVSDNTELTEMQTWRLFGLAIVLLITVGAARLVPKHLVLACFAGGVATVALVVWTVWPIWSLVFLALFALGGWVSERSNAL